MAPKVSALDCPKCGGGIAVATFSDANGTNYKCGYCQHGFTQPSSEDTTAGALARDPRVYPETVAGSPGMGSVGPDGKEAEHQVKVMHPDAGPAPELVDAGKAKGGKS